MSHSPFSRGRRRAAAITAAVLTGVLILTTAGPASAGTRQAPAAAVPPVAVPAAAALPDTVPAEFAVPALQAAAASPDRRVNITLIGDSFSAGNGAEDYFNPTMCFRSRSNWSMRYRNWLYDQGYEAELFNRACSNGVMADYWNQRDVGTLPEAGNCHTGTADEIITTVADGGLTSLCNTKLRPQKE